MESLRLLVLIGLTATLFPGIINLSAQTSDGLPDHPPPLSPDRERQRLKVADGLEIKLVAAEPTPTLDRRHWEIRIRPPLECR